MVDPRLGLTGRIITSPGGFWRLEWIDPNKKEKPMSDATLSLISPEAERKFILFFDAMSTYIHEWAIRKGFWEQGKQRNDAEMICLMHSELSECLEGIRHGNPPDSHIPEFNSAEVELADCVIRIMDTASARGWRVAEAIVAKMQFNEGRAHKHGKAF